jgi:hypothetical protein
LASEDDREAIGLLIAHEKALQAFGNAHVTNRCEHAMTDVNYVLRRLDELSVR